MLKGFWGIFFILVHLAFSPAYGAFSCRAFLEKKETVAVSKPSLRFMSYNVANLYLHKGKYVWTEEGLTKVNQDHLPNQKPEEQTQGVANAILELDPDFLLLQEVEGMESLERFNRHYLDSEYETYMPPTNDLREIGVALLVKKKLGVIIDVKTSVHLEWVTPKGRTEKVFSRNFPIFKIYKEGEAEPRLMLAGVHLKSQRDRSGDPNSYYKRQAEMKAGVKALEDVKLEHPDAPIMVMGDFNSSRGDNEVTPVFGRLGLLDTHLSEEHFLDVGGLGRNTHTYHPNAHVKGQEGKAIKTVLDRALISKRLLESLLRSAIYRYRENGTNEKKPLPSSFAEREQNPSDHFPIYFDLGLSVLFD